LKFYGKLTEVAEESQLGVCEHNGCSVQPSME